MNWWLFIAGFVFDFLYIVWYWSTEKNKPITGGLTSVAMVGIGMLGIFEALDNRWNLVPYFSGLFLGSYVGIKWKHRK